MSAGDLLRSAALPLSLLLCSRHLCVLACRNAVRERAGQADPPPRVAQIGDDSMSALVYPPQHQQAAVADAFGSSLQTALMSDDCRRMGNFFGRSETCAMPEDWAMWAPKRAWV